MTASAIFGTISSIQSGEVINALIARNFTAVAIAIAAVALFDVGSECVRQIGSMLTIKIYHVLRSEICEMLFAKAQQLPLSDTVDGNVSELLSRTTADADAFANLICYVLAPLVQAILSLAAALVFMLRANVPMTLTALSFVPIWLVILLKPDDHVRRLRENLFKAQDRIQNTVVDALSFAGLLRVKSYESYRFDLQRLKVLNELLSSYGVRWFRANTAQSLSLSVTASLFGHILTLIVGSMLIARGSIDVGTLVTFLVLLGRLYNPVEVLATAGVNVKTNSLATQRIAELLEKDSQKSGSAEIASDNIEAIGLRVDFNERLVFDNVNLTIKPFEWIALLGDNGCGKTTLARMFPRLMEVQRGAILYGGSALTDVALSDVRSRIIMVAQHDSLFHGTIRENISYGIACSDETLWDMLETVEMADRTRLDPLGLDAVVQPLGTELSSGERQRLALARALLRRPTLLILDEAMSNIDVNSERRILFALRERSSSALLFIAHRDVPQNLFDRIVTLGRGGLAHIYST
jgi:ABC-type multidrug transport system fused ATPase/permease subunit